MQYPKQMSQMKELIQSEFLRDEDKRNNKDDNKEDEEHECHNSYGKLC